MDLKIKNLFFPIFLAVTMNSWGQYSPLTKYNFSNGNYFLIGLKTIRYNGRMIPDSSGHFYISNIQVLNEIKKEWVFRKRAPIEQCDFDYTVYICIGQKAVDSFFINLLCEEINFDYYTSYRFDPHQLNMFKNSFQNLTLKIEGFPSISEGRLAVKNIEMKTDLLITNKPDWLKYDGEFNFTYPHPPIKNRKEFDKMFEHLKAEFQKNFPGEVFELEDAGGSRDELFVNVKSSEALYNKFKLYPLNWKKWEPYEPILTSYWKVN